MSQLRAARRFVVSRVARGHVDRVRVRGRPARPVQDARGVHITHSGLLGLVGPGSVCGMRKECE